MLWSSLFAAFLASAGCVKKDELGRPGNPVKLLLVPATDPKALEASAKTFKAYLEKTTGFRFAVSFPQSFADVVDAFVGGKADVAAIDTFGYLKASEDGKAEARLTVIQNGVATYRSQFIAKTESTMKTVADLAGKKIAFVDSSSASGYLLPMKTLKDKKIEPRETVFAMKPDAVVAMVYQGQADAGATFYAAPSAQGIEDGRRLVKTQYPDVERKVKIVELTDALPNDPIVLRKDLPDAMKDKIAAAFLSFLTTAEGKKTFKDLFAVDELKPSADKDYDSVRAMLTTLGKTPDDFIRK